MKHKSPAFVIIHALLLAALLCSCGIPTDTQPRDIDPSQQMNLNKP